MSLFHQDLSSWHRQLRLSRSLFLIDLCLGIAGSCQHCHASGSKCSLFRPLILRRLRITASRFKSRLGVRWPGESCSPDNSTSWHDGCTSQYGGCGSPARNAGRRGCCAAHLLPSFGPCQCSDLTVPWREKPAQWRTPRTCACLSEERRRSTRMNRAPPYHAVLDQAVLSWAVSGDTSGWLDYCDQRMVFCKSGCQPADSFEMRERDEPEAGGSMTGLNAEPNESR